jgi:hypothetical protein
MNTLKEKTLHWHTTHPLERSKLSTFFNDSQQIKNLVLMLLITFFVVLFFLLHPGKITHNK